jgi:hypothetical protein
MVVDGLLFSVIETEAQRHIGNLTFIASIPAEPRQVYSIGPKYKPAHKELNGKVCGCQSSGHGKPPSHFGPASNGGTCHRRSFSTGSTSDGGSAGHGGRFGC